MALDMSNAVADAMEQEVVRHYELRGIRKVLSAADRRRLAFTSAMVEELAGNRALGVMKAFLNHMLPVGGGRFRQIRNVYFEWRTWSAEVYPTIEHLFPVTTEDEEVLSRFFSDWRKLREDRGFYRTVFRRPSAIGGARMAPAYRHTPDFLRVLAVLRRYQGETARYPLFTLRGYVAAQIEALSGFVPTLQIGNFVSEKARTRYDEWYLYRFYNLELVKKGLKRPSDNNPVSNPMVRIEYEHHRAGTSIGDFTFDGEVPVPWMTRPAMKFGDGEVSDEVVEECGSIKLPPGMGDLLG